MTLLRDIFAGITSVFERIFGAVGDGIERLLR